MTNKESKYNHGKDKTLNNHLSLHEEGGNQEFKDFTVTREWMKKSVSKTLEAFGLK